MKDDLLDMIGKDGEDRRRVIIIDYNHLAWRYAFSKASSLSVNRLVNGVSTVIDTTVPSYTIKQIVRWSNFGVNPTIVCMDSPTPSRTEYFRKAVEKEIEGMIETDYKGARIPTNSDFIQSIEIAGSLMAQGGIYVFKEHNYEADDLIFACVQKAKKDYPYLPIDVITGDSDMIPLVDEQVSVYVKSKTHTYANEVSPTISKYVQYTPESYQDYAQELSKFKNLTVPYNTLLLAKILRGDSADGLKGKPDWKPKMYNELMEIFFANEDDVDNLCRYGAWESNVIDKRTNEVVTSWSKEDVPHLFEQYTEPKELTLLLETLAKYVEDSDLEFVKHRYIGMCLNGAILDVDDQYKRRPYKIKSSEPFTGFDIYKLQQAVNVLDIRLPMG